MSNSIKCNLLELLDSVDEFSVPKIQRDYAQGRKNGSDAELCREVRSDFINSLHSVLLKSEDKLLDYVYGENNTKVYKPIDGQQRLTTLFLIYWYVGKRERVDVNNANEFAKLEKFSYEVRDTSKEFCKSLIKTNIDFTKGNISDQIKNSVHYHNAYDYDPTIASMLVVLDEIHNVFNPYYTPGAPGLWTNLSKIRFWCLPLENFGLTDDLFVKMNARGKKLTRFDVFKSDFESCLERILQKNANQGNLIKKWKEEIDNSFLDSFWAKFGADYAERNLFRTILFFVKSLIYSSSADQKVYDSAWEKDDSRAIYSDIINYVENNPDTLSSLFNILSNFGNWESKATDYSLLINDNKYSPNIVFYKKAYLFSVMYWFSFKPQMQKDPNFTEFERILNNYIFSLRDYDISSRIYLSSIDNDRYKLFLNNFIKLIGDFYNSNATAGTNASFYKYVVSSNQQYLKYEIEKIEYINQGQSQKDDLHKLEEVPFLSRNINNFFFNKKIYLKADVLKDIAASEDLINKSLRIIYSYADAASGSFEKLLMDKRTKQSGYKQLFYYNDQDQVTYWRHRLFFSANSDFGDRIFTSTDSVISACVKKFAESLNNRIYNQNMDTATAIDNIFKDRQNYADFSDNSNVLWYIVKYDEFFYSKKSTTLYVCRRKNYDYYITDDDNVYGMECLNDSSNFYEPHYQPFYKALAAKLTGNVTIQSDLDCIGVNIYDYPCILSNNWIIEIDKNGNWIIRFPGNVLPANTPGLKIRQDNNGTNYAEYDCSGKDSIEEMAKYINSLP